MARLFKHRRESAGHRYRQPTATAPLLDSTSLSCNLTLAAIQTRSFETVQERLGILMAQSVNAPDVLAVYRAWRSGAAPTGGNG